MIEAYLAQSPAAMKVLVLLEEAGLNYRIMPISVSDGEQHSAEFRAISPNNKVPAIVDYSPADSTEPITLFESGAIMVYLAEKTGQFLPVEQRSRVEVLQWLFWQAAGLSPMSGQAAHFLTVLPEQANEYAQNRYRNEVNRLYGVLNKQLEERNFITDEYSIADMAAYTWTLLSEFVGQDISQFPNLDRWQKSISGRPAVKRAYQRIEDESPTPKAEFRSEVFLKNMFGHTAKSLGLI